MHETDATSRAWLQAGLGTNPRGIRSTRAGLRDEPGRLHAIEVEAAKVVTRIQHFRLHQQAAVGEQQDADGDGPAKCV
jgi:hypothetical protein